VAVVPIDGNVRVSWLTALASLAAPTVAELNAGTLLTGFITPDGLDISWATGNVNAGNLGSTQNAALAGRRTPTMSITFHHDGATDTAYNLMVYRAAGFWVIRYGVLATTAWTIGDKVEAYPAQIGQTSQVKPAPDGTWDFTVPVTVTADANTRAVVA
jgi:hypothetical protein